MSSFHSALFAATLCAGSLSCGETVLIADAGEDTAKRGALASEDVNREAPETARDATFFPDAAMDVGVFDASCYRDASATPAPPRACCASQSDCQLDPPWLYCCVEHRCNYCGPK